MKITAITVIKYDGKEIKSTLNSRFAANSNGIEHPIPI